MAEVPIKQRSIKQINLGIGLIFYKD